MNPNVLDPEKSVTLYKLLDVSSTPFAKLDLSSEISNVNKRHRLRGEVVHHEGNVLILVKFLRLNFEKLDPTRCQVMSYGWDGTYGAAITFTVYQGSSNEVHIEGRAYIPSNHPNLNFLKGSKLFLGFVVNNKIKKICALDYMANSSERGIEVALKRVNNHKPELLNTEVHYWELFKLSPSWKKVLNIKDKLSMGWYSQYSFELQHLLKFYEEKDEYERKKDLIETLPKNSRDVIRSFFENGVQSAIDIAAERSRDGVYFEDLMKSAEILYADDPETKLAYLNGSILRVHLDSPGNTLFGQKIGWVRGNNTHCEYQDLDIRNWTEEMVESFWKTVETGFRVDRPHYLQNDDYPIDPIEENKSWKIFKLGCSIEEAESMTSALLEEASLNKKWTIPPRAVISLQIGHFTSIEMTEIWHEIYCVLRAPDKKYFLLSVNPYKQEWALGFRHKIDQSNYSLETQAALKLTISALIRDFWVVEDRKIVFDRTQTASGKPKNLDNQASSPIVVYLPRIRYEYDSAVNIESCVKDLDLTNRRKHYVKAHQRKSENPSSVQLDLARLYGISVEQGFTFVRPHERGAVEREVIFRSRSALQLLYGERVQSSNSLQKPDWFEFERDVAKMLKKHQFEIIGTSRPGTGDSGIDITAHKKVNDTIEVWLIQCKCYSNKVGPNHIRELAGAVSLYGSNAKGMLVTTSYFTKDALTQAIAANIKLMDGKRFLEAIDGAIAFLG